MWKILAIYVITVFMKLYGYFISVYLILLADAMHTISDIVIIFLLMYSGIISKKPPDASHPFGHEMVRNVASLVAAVSFITVISFELFKEGVYRVLSPAEEHFNTWLVIMIEIAVLVLLVMASYILSRKSGILDKTLFIESLNDSLSTVAAIAGILLISIGYKIFDGVVSILIALMIFYNSAKLVKQNTRFLLGMSPPDEFYHKVEEISLKFDEVKGVHDMVATYIGENKIHLDMHITVDSKTSVEEADKLSERIAEELQRKLPEIGYVIVHICPHYGEKRKIM